MICLEPFIISRILQYFPITEWISQFHPLPQTDWRISWFFWLNDYFRNFSPYNQLVCDILFRSIGEFYGFFSCNKLPKLASFFFFIWSINLFYGFFSVADWLISWYFSLKSWCISRLLSTIYWQNSWVFLNDFFSTPWSTKEFHDFFVTNWKISLFFH